MQHARLFDVLLFIDLAMCIFSYCYPGRPPLSHPKAAYLYFSVARIRMVGRGVELLVSTTTCVNRHAADRNDHACSFLTLLG